MVQDNNFATLVLAFILASCFYRKHIRDWKWFRIGLFAFLAYYICPWLGGLHSISLASILMHGTLLVSGLSLVLACLRDARLETQHLRCLNCGYILKGLSEPRCPECGQTI